MVKPVHFSKKRLAVQFSVLVSAIMVVAITGASLAYGLVYMWRDASGVTHYVNKEYEIPARYKARAKALYPEPGDSTTAPPRNAVSSEPKAELQLPAVVVTPPSAPPVSASSPTPVVAAPPQKQLPVVPVRKRVRMRGAEEE
jgi:hypothetical protein